MADLKESWKSTGKNLGHAFRDLGKTGKLPEIIKLESTLAQRLLELQKEDDRIGFESSNHYFYYRNELLEKTVNCAYLLKTLQQKNIS